MPSQGNSREGLGLHAQLQAPEVTADCHTPLGAPGHSKPWRRGQDGRKEGGSGGAAGSHPLPSPLPPSCLCSSSGVGATQGCCGPLAPICGQMAPQCMWPARAVAVDGM